MCGCVALYDEAPCSAACKAHRLEFIASLGHKSYLIEEEAGLPLDTRNLLNLPRHRRENMNVDGGRNGHSRTPTKGSPTLRRYEQHGILV